MTLFEWTICPLERSTYTAAWTGCIAGALTRDEYVTKLGKAGLNEISVEETNRFHPDIYATTVRAVKASNGARFST